MTIDKKDVKKEHILETEYPVTGIEIDNEHLKIYENTKSFPWLFTLDGNLIYEASSDAYSNGIPRTI